MSTEPELKTFRIDAASELLVTDDRILRFEHRRGGGHSIRVVFMDAAGRETIASFSVNRGDLESAYQAVRNV